MPPASRKDRVATTANEAERRALGAQRQERLQKHWVELQQDFERLAPSDKAYFTQLITKIRELLQIDTQDKLTATEQDTLNELLVRLNTFQPKGWNHPANEETFTFWMDLANNEQAMESPENNSDEFAAIEERGLELSRAVDTISSLGLAGIDTQVRIAGLHEISVRCEELARRLGMQAIAEGTMTQVQLSRLLGVAELTVSRWMKTAKDKAQ